MRQSTSITGCVRGRLVGWLVGNAFVRRSTRRTLLTYLTLFVVISTTVFSFFFSTSLFFNRIQEEIHAEMPGPQPKDLRELLWNRGTAFNDDTGERYHPTDRAHKTPNSLTTHELSLVMSKKSKREIRLKRGLKHPDESMKKPKPGPSVIYNIPSGAMTERESRLRRSMKDIYKVKNQKFISNLSSIATDDEEENVDLPRLYPYSDKMDNM